MIIYLQADQRFRCFILDFCSEKFLRRFSSQNLDPANEKFPSLWLIQRYEPVRKIIFGPKLTHKELKNFKNEHFRQKMTLFVQKI